MFYHPSNNNPQNITQQQQNLRASQQLGQQVQQQSGHITAHKLTGQSNSNNNNIHTRDTTVSNVSTTATNSNQQCSSAGQYSTNGQDSMQLDAQNMQVDQNIQQNAQQTMTVQQQQALYAQQQQNGPNGGFLQNNPGSMMQHQANRNSNSMQSGRCGSQQFNNFGSAINSYGGFSQFTSGADTVISPESGMACAPSGIQIHQSQHQHGAESMESSSTGDSSGDSELSPRDENDDDSMQVDSPHMNNRGTTTRQQQATGGNPSSTFNNYNNVANQQNSNQRSQSLHQQNRASQVAEAGSLHDLNNRPASFGPTQTSRDSRTRSRRQPANNGIATGINTNNGINSAMEVEPMNPALSKKEQEALLLQQQLTHNHNNNVSSNLTYPQRKQQKKIRSLRDPTREYPDMEGKYALVKAVERTDTNTDHVIESLIAILTSVVKKQDDERKANQGVGGTNQNPVSGNLCSQSSNASSLNGEAVTVFHASRIPSLTISDYMHRLARYFNCSNECYVIALVYLERICGAKDQATGDFAGSNLQSSYGADELSSNMNSLDINGAPMVPTSQGVVRNPKITSTQDYSDTFSTIGQLGIVAQSLSYPEPNSYTIHRLILTALIIAAKYHDDLYCSNTYYAKVGGVHPDELNTLELAFLRFLKWRTYVRPDEYEAYRQVVELVNANRAANNGSGIISQPGSRQ